MRRALLLFIALQVILVHGGHAATQSQVDQAFARGMKFMLLNQHRDGGWSASVQDGNVARQGLGVQATGAMVEVYSALRIAGYSNLGAVSWLSNTEAASVDALSRQILALKAAGQDVTALVSRLAAARNASRAWGAYAGYETDLPDDAYGIVALLAAQGSAYAVADLLAALCPILSSQRADGLWSTSVATTSGPPSNQAGTSLIPSAVALLALVKASSVVASNNCGATRYTLNAVIATATAALAARQSSIDKGFGDNGVSGVLETALVLRALKAVAAAGAVAALDYLVAQQGADGSWGAGDIAQTAEVLLALAAASSVSGQVPSSAATADTDRDGIPDIVESLLGTNGTIADSRFLADGAGEAVTSATAMRVAAAAATAATAAMRLSADAQPNANGWKERSDIELFVAGTAAERPVLEQALASLIDVSSMEVFSAASYLPSDLYHAYSGVLSGRVPARLVGKRLLVHFSADGGSHSAVAPLARMQSVTRLAIDSGCAATAHRGRWLCSQILRDRVPDAGIAESDPLLHARANASEMPVGIADLRRLDAAPINRLRWGVGASRALVASGIAALTPSALHALTSGSVMAWSEVDRRLPAKPAMLCRLPDGAQPAAMGILGTGCRPAEVSLASVASSNPAVLSAPGRLIEQGDSYADMDRCLIDADEGATLTTEGGPMQLPAGTLAIGLMPRTYAQRQPRGWLAQDFGMSTAWMQWRKAAAWSAGVPTDEQLLVLAALRQAMADPLLLESVPGVLPLRSGRGAPSANAPGCEPLSAGP